MIPFFRKIRKKMADDNKPLKYARYAIGEIALVVIGILIALQINNWNEDRKTAKQEIKILNDLKNDLETNLNEISETYNSTSQRQMSSALILDYFKNTKPVDDSLKKAFEKLEQDVLFNIANTSYKFIESQGINSLSNDSLRIRVTEMYERHLTNIVTRENMNRQIVNQELIPLMQEHFVSTATVDKNNLIAPEAVNMPKNITDKEIMTYGTAGLTAALSVNELLNNQITSGNQALSSCRLPVAYAGNCAWKPPSLW